MINHLDNLLRHLLLTQLPQLNTEAQIRFRPPDEDWRNEVQNNIQALALNIYLLDLRENRRLRSNARVRTGEVNGNVMLEPAPARMDCHYLISAWSPAQPGPAVEPTPDEHALLYNASAVLMNNTPLNPTAVYGEGAPPLAAIPDLIRNADLPVSILPVEGFPKLSEFWSTMGGNHRWKPVIYVTATLPVALVEENAGPIVTTRITEFRPANDPSAIETAVQIGGQVRSAAGALIEDALVDVVDAGLRAKTDENGRFSFPLVPQGSRTLRAVAVGFTPAIRVVEVPDPFNSYDFELSVL